ncbi:hypothetical protein ACS0TY_006986 [Phlomoides rotata]
MAAYAALVSLMNIMEQILNHPRLSTSFDNYQIQSLGEKLDFLLDFLENYDSHGCISEEKTEDLEGKIAIAAHKAEDAIESHVVDRILAGSTGDDRAQTRSNVLLDLQKIIEEVDSITEKARELKEERGLKSPIFADSSTSLTTGKTRMVGFNSYVVQLSDWLTGQQSNRQIIPISGMGGIGKTTLARNVYENTLILQHFDVLAWVTISQEYNVRKILLEALSCLKESTSELDGKSEYQLGEQLHKVLWGRRYLIVLDDMWSIEPWSKINVFFPNNYNRSRIIVTTRLLDVANHLGSLGLAVDFLNDDESWTLFCDKAFAIEDCPRELEQIGKKVVKKCKGLPLSIVVIGGLLGKSSRTQEHWKSVARDLSSAMDSGEGNECLNVLSLSYTHLPVHLKPCFLYLGIFSEDYEMRVSQLIKLWVAEGFLKPNYPQTLEEVAEGYVKDLVVRNLILVRRLRWNGKPKTCYVHDLVRDLCLKVAEKEKFFCVRKANSPRDMDGRRRIIIHESSKGDEYRRVFVSLNPRSLVRSIICELPVLQWFNARLVRVLVEVYSGSQLDPMFQQVNLRFLSSKSCHSPIHWSYHYQLPSSISLLWNVQTLVITGKIGKVLAPSDIWEMPQLRHLQFHSLYLPDPQPRDEEDGIVLTNLQTLRSVLNFRFSEEACKRMPNIKRLHTCFRGSWEEDSFYCLNNVGLFTKLESLKYSFYDDPNRNLLLQSLKMLNSLKKLTLLNCKLHWEDLTIIGSLLHLEVLKLSDNSVVGTEWSPVEGEFLRLKFLRICSCPDLVYWNADSTHFPVLEQLVLVRLLNLDEIPLGIGEIPTLEHICVGNCSISAAVSAVKVLEEQEGFGNQELRVRLMFGFETHLEEFREKVEVVGITTHNFQVLKGGETF